MRLMHIQCRLTDRPIRFISFMAYIGDRSKGIGYPCDLRVWEASPKKDKGRTVYNPGRHVTAEEIEQMRVAVNSALDAELERLKTMAVIEPLSEPPTEKSDV